MKVDSELERGPQKTSMPCEDQFFLLINIAYVSVYGKLCSHMLCLLHVVQVRMFLRLSLSPGLYDNLDALLSPSPHSAATGTLEQHTVTLDSQSDIQTGTKFLMVW